MYSPLPDSITIKESTIQGLGLFAKENISKDEVLGVIHIPIPKEKDGYHRTPLGGFGNHSDNPNCNKILMEDGSWWLTTNQNIMAGEEITWCYTIYSISK